MIYKIGSNGLEDISVKQTDKRNGLKRGTILHLNGYNCPDFVIVKNRGIEGMNCYGTIYDTINLTEFTKSRHDAIHLEYIGEKSSDKIQTYYTDESLPEEQVKDIEAYAKRVSVWADEIATKEAEARKKAKAELPERFPFLETLEKTKKSTHALAASNIKRELTAMFPGLKFSVKSDTFAGGDSVDVSWTDGPRQETVQAAINKYSQGTFNGMIDLYEYDHENIWGEVFGSAKYVSAQRHNSRGAIQETAEKLGYTVEFGKWDEITNLDDPIKQTIYREVRKTDFYERPEGTEAEKPKPTRKEKPETPKNDNGVTVGEYKGHPTITLPCNGKGFTFGLAKARAVLNYIEEIKGFIEEAGK